MADLAGTEKQKRSKKSTQDTPPRCANDKPKREPEEGEGREFQCCAISIRKMFGKKKTYNPSIDFIENSETLMRDPENP